MGGHCIGVDPYYFTYKAEKLGYHSQIVLAGRKVNDGMGEFVADAAIKQMILAGKAVRNANVVILVLTFKENCPDTRKSKVEDIINRLKQFDIAPIIVDLWASEKDAIKEYGVFLTKRDDVHDVDYIIMAIAHNEFKSMPLSEIDNLFINADENGEKLLIDVKGILNREEVKKNGYRYWRL